jgi:hypothetical protein
VKQIDLLLYVLEVMDRLQISYLLVGSFASSIYGEARATLDIDLVIDLQTSQIKDFCSSFSSPDFYLSESADREAVQTRFQFNVLHPATGNKIDFILVQDDEWGHQQLANRQLITLTPDRQGYAALPEDVILGKLRYYHEGRSEKHLRDITGILKLQGNDLDHRYVAKWAEKLGVLPWWEMILERMQSSK